MKTEVLGVRIDDLSLTEVLNFLQRTSAPQLIFTPNPEFIVEAQNNPEFKKILNGSNLNVPDGVGLQIFGRIKNRVPGIDLMLKLCKFASENGLTVGLFGGTDGVAKETKTSLEQKFSEIKITWAIDGREADIYLAEAKPFTEKSVDFLFAALGMVKQENFLQKLSLQGKILRVGVGVGGSFDEITNRQKAPPEFIKKIGLKWLWRLACEPKRVRRIINAVIVFPWLVFYRAAFQGDFHSN